MKKDSSSPSSPSSPESRLGSNESQVDQAVLILTGEVKRLIETHGGVDLKVLFNPSKVELAGDKDGLKEVGEVIGALRAALMAVFVQEKIPMEIEIGGDRLVVQENLRSDGRECLRDRQFAMHRNLSIDDKGRLMVPADVAPALFTGGLMYLYVSQNPDGSYFVVLSGDQNLPLPKDRFLIHSVQSDSKGRIIVPDGSLPRDKIGNTCFDLYTCGNFAVMMPGGASTNGNGKAKFPGASLRAYQTEVFPYMDSKTVTP